jgi:hypothetical protein
MGFAMFLVFRSTPGANANAEVKRRGRKKLDLVIIGLVPR